MKIKLKITADELLFLEKKTYQVTGININDLPREKKSAYTILLDVSDKVANKAKNVNRQVSNGKKKHDVSLKWHEAEVLEMFLIGFYEHDVLCKNLSRKIVSQINQKLA